MRLLVKRLSLASVEVGACDAVEEDKTKLAIIVTRPLRYPIQTGPLSERRERDLPGPRVARHCTDARIRSMPEQSLIVELHELEGAKGREFRPRALLHVWPAYQLLLGFAVQDGFDESALDRNGGTHRAILGGWRVEPISGRQAWLRSKPDRPIIFAVNPDNGGTRLEKFALDAAPECSRQAARRG
jgi:hypothetical protein